MDDETIVAMNDPQPGDRFTEMFSFWVYILRRTGSLLTVMEFTMPPFTDTRDHISNKEYTLDEFKRRFSYGEGSPGYWIRLYDRGNEW